jgi:hypothetical protein
MCYNIFIKSPMESQLFKILTFIKILFISSILLMSGFASAQNSKTIADIKTELISSMEKDGYLSQKMAGEVSQKYITEADKTTVSKPMTMGASQVEQAQAKAKQSASWKDYLSWINFVKVLGVICLLIAFSGMIKKIIAGLWVFIAAVPMILYQAVFLGVGIVGIFRPDLISVSQQFYVALFFAFANLIVIGWIISTHKKIEEFIAKLFKLGIPPSCLASFYGMIYFAALAYFYQSSIFGFFAAVCLSGVFSFGLYYMPGVLYLNFKESMLPAVVFGHLAVLAIYTFMFKTHPEYTMFFDAGIQYYCTVALAVGLIVGASPFYKKDSAIGYGVLFVILFFAASYGFHLYGMPVVSSIIIAFFILFILEWIGYIGYKSGMIMGTAIIGGALYATAMLMEKYGSMLILTMN